MAKTLIDAIYDHRVMVHRCAELLDVRANAASILGLNDLAEELWAIAEELETSSKDVQTAHSLEINRRAADSEAASRAMVEGVIVGVIMGKESKR